MMTFFIKMQQHRFSYDEPMPVESCTQALSDVALSFGEDDEQEESRMVRHACVSNIQPSHHFK